MTVLAWSAFGQASKAAAPILRKPSTLEYVSKRGSERADPCLPRPAHQSFFQTFGALAILRKINTESLVHRTKFGIASLNNPNLLCRMLSTRSRAMPTVLLPDSQLNVCHSSRLCVHRHVFLGCCRCRSITPVFIFEALLAHLKMRCPPFDCCM